MDMEQIKEQLKESKKKLIILGVVMVFGAYMMWPGGGTPVEEEGGGELDAQLAQLQAERDAGGGGGPAPVFDGTDERGIAVSGGGDGAPGAFQTKPPLVVGTVVGFGTKTDFDGEYLVSYISVQNTPGYEVDMREVVGYSLDVPPYLAEEKQVRVYGEFTGPTSIKARAIQ